MPRPLAALFLLVALAAGVRAGARSTTLEFPRFNGTFHDLAPEIAPVSGGGLTVLLSSPANSLTIRKHSLELEPLGGDAYRFRGTVDFLGKADLVAEFGNGVPGRVEDQVLLPIQTLRVEGELLIVDDPEGYAVTTRKLPPFAEIAMTSRLGNQLLSLCDVMSLLTGGDCAGLVAAFGRVRLPLPPPGETYLLPGDRLTEEERRLLDGALRSAG